MLSFDCLCCCFCSTVVSDLTNKQNSWTMQQAKLVPVRILPNDCTNIHLIKNLREQQTNWSKELVIKQIFICLYLQIFICFLRVYACACMHVCVHTSLLTPGRAPLCVCSEGHTDGDRENCSCVLVLLIVFCFCFFAAVVFFSSCCISGLLVSCFSCIGVVYLSMCCAWSVCTCTSVWVFISVCSVVL